MMRLKRGVLIVNSMNWCEDVEELEKLLCDVGAISHMLLLRRFLLEMCNLRERIFEGLDNVRKPFVAITVSISFSSFGCDRRHR